MANSGQTEMGIHQPLYRNECQRLIVAKKWGHISLYVEVNDKKPSTNTQMGLLSL